MDKWKVTIAVLGLALSARANQDMLCFPSMTTETYVVSGKSLEVMIVSSPEEHGGEIRSLELKTETGAVVLASKAYAGVAFRLKVGFVVKRFTFPGPDGARSGWSLNSEVIGLYKSGQFVRVRDGMWRMQILSDGSYHVSLEYSLNGQGEEVELAAGVLIARDGIDLGSSNRDRTGEYKRRGRRMATIRVVV